jgi:hypothetical protein
MQIKKKLLTKEATSNQPTTKVIVKPATKPVSI